MSKEYRYRKHIRILNKVLPTTLFVLGGFMLVLDIILIYYMAISDQEAIEMFPFFLFLTIFVLIEGFVIRHFYKKLATTVVSLNEEGISFKNCKEEIFVRYDDIKKIGNPSIKYTGGWITIESNQKPIRLTVVVERIHEFIAELKQQLDNRGLQHTYNESSLFSFFKTATYSDMSWVRMYRIFYKYFALQILAPIATGVLVGFLGGSVARFLLILFSTLIPLFIYVITEILLGVKMRTMLLEGQFVILNNDVELENAMYKKSLFIGLFLFIGLILLVFIA